MVWRLRLKPSNEEALPNSRLKTPEATVGRIGKEPANPTGTIQARTGKGINERRSKRGNKKRIMIIKPNSTGQNFPL